MDYIINESKFLRIIREYAVDKYSDDTLYRIISKLVKSIYGGKLTMKVEKDGYVKFLSSGPVAPYHKNLAGRLWIDDDRLPKLIMEILSIDIMESLALVAFYFSKAYDIHILDAKPHAGHWDDIDDIDDYEKFDNPNYVEEEEDEY